MEAVEPQGGSSDRSDVSEPTASTATGVTASRRHLPRLPPLDTGGYRRGSEVQHTRRIFLQMCEVMEEAEAAARAAAEAAARAAAVHGINTGAPSPGGLAGRRVRGAQRHRQWEPHGCSEEQQAELAMLGAQMRELILQLEACAEELVGAAAELQGPRLQQLLAALEEAGEGLLSDFLRATVYSGRIADGLISAVHSSGSSRHTQQTAAAPAPAGQQTCPAAKGLAAVRAVRGNRARAAGQRSREEQQAAWRSSVYGLAGLEGGFAGGGGALSSAETIVVPQVFRTVVMRTPSRRRKDGWLPGLLAGTTVGGMSDEDVRASVFQAAAAQPEGLAEQPGRPLVAALEQRRRGLRGQLVGQAGAQLSLPHRALMHAIAGRRFQREIAAARASQQHHSEEEGDGGQTEAQRYAEMLAQLPQAALCGGRSGDGATGACGSGAAACGDGSSGAAGRQPGLGKGAGLAGPGCSGAAGGCMEPVHVEGEASRSSSPEVGGQQQAASSSCGLHAASTQVPLAAAALPVGPPLSCLESPLFLCSPSDLLYCL